MACCDCLHYFLCGRVALIAHVRDSASASVTDIKLIEGGIFVAERISPLVSGVSLCLSDMRRLSAPVKLYEMALSWMVDFGHFYRGQSYFIGRLRFS